MTLAFKSQPSRKIRLREAEFLAERENIHAQMFAQSEQTGKRNVRTIRDDSKTGRSYRPNMARKPKSADHYAALRKASGWYLSAWRDFRKVSQQELADEMGTTKGNVSDLENGAVNKRGIATRYNRDWLELACAALDVAAGDLIDTNPFEDEPRFAAMRRAFPTLKRDDIATLADMAAALERRKA